MGHGFKSPPGCLNQPGFSLVLLQAHLCGKVPVLSGHE
jgi:hypothetical protein